MDRQEMITWMAGWAARSGCQLDLEGECGFGRECVGVVGPNGSYPDYEWSDERYDRIDPNGDVWTPKDAYHKHPCVAVLGRGEDAESQLYAWLRWFDDKGFAFECVASTPDPSIPTQIVEMLGRDRQSRMIRKMYARP